MDQEKFSFPLDLNFAGTIVLRWENAQVFTNIEIWKSLSLLAG